MSDIKKLSTKIRQVNTITLRCPKGDACIDALFTAMVIALPKHRPSEIDGETVYPMIPTIDLFNVVQSTISYCDSSDIDGTHLDYIKGIIQSFKRLKYVSVTFTDDPYVKTVYADADVSGGLEGLYRIYHVDVLELMLSDIVNQNVIDIFNRTLIFDGLLPNDYLKRRFVVEFTFDEYTAFTDMIVNNNMIYFDSEDGKPALEALKVFPKIMGEHKPVMRVVTDYAML